MATRQRLLAKLTRPRLYSAVARERLFAQLDEARGRRSAICIVGPPGAGKTTLAASWLDARDAKGIWYQVDAGDTDLATFFHYLGQAAEPFARKGMPPMPALTPEYHEDVAGFSRRFFRELFARLPAGAVVVLDNYQEIAPEQSFHSLVSQAVDEVPAGVVLVAISRRDPPDAYARLIANEHVELVDWDQLKLTLEEANEIASSRISLDPHELADLHATSGGWAAGFTLLLEGRRRNGISSTDLPEGRDAIFDYFAAQIFARVPEAMQRFLVATAFLPQVPVSIARELTGNDDAERILDDLHRRHLFIHRRPGTEPVYWYHALFREFLKGRADTALGKVSMHDLLSRAARLLDASGAFDDAFELFKEAADWSAAARLIERRAADLLAHGRGQTLRDWIQCLPEDLCEAHPWIRYWLGTSLIPVDLTRARICLECSFRQFQEIGDPSGEAMCAAGIIDSFVFEWSTFRPVRKWVDVLANLVDRLNLSANAALERRIVSSLLLGLLYVAPGHTKLPWCVTRATEMLDEEFDVPSKLETAMILLAYCNITYDRDRAAIAMACGSALADHAAVTPFLRLWWSIRCALQLTLQGRYESAIATLDAAEGLARTHGFHHLPTVMSLMWGYRAITTSTQRDPRATQRSFELIVAAAHSGRLLNLYNAKHANLYRQLALGNEEAFATMGIECIESARDTGMIYLNALAQEFHAIGLAVTGQRAALTERIAEVRALVRGTCFPCFEIDMDLVEAWTALRHDDRAQGLKLLADVLQRARTARWTPGSTLRATRLHRELLAEACDAGIEVDYVTELINRFRLVAPERASERWPWPVRIHTLGKFEIVVEGAALAFAGKVPRKPLALLKVVVALGPQPVPASIVIDTLWPDEEGDAARKAFDVTTSRLRKLLGRNDALTLVDEAVTLNRKVCWVDADQFLAISDIGDFQGDVTDRARRACALYAGMFLPGDCEASWAVQRRERLRARFVRLVEQVGTASEADSDWDDAIAWYGRGLEADELAETFHLGLMRCYRAQGRNAEGMSAYRRLRQTLSLTLGIAPSEQSQALARALQQDGAPT